MHTRRESDAMESEYSISLKEFVSEKFRALEQMTESSRLVMEKRLEGMNEFRASLRDQNNTFITRNEVEGKFAAICVKIDALQRLLYIGVGIALVLELVLRWVG